VVPHHLKNICLHVIENIKNDKGKNSNGNVKFVIRQQNWRGKDIFFFKSRFILSLQYHISHIN
jgi:hypothetical protein